VKSLCVIIIKRQFGLSLSLYLCKQLKKSCHMKDDSKILRGLLLCGLSISDFFLIHSLGGHLIHRSAYTGTYTVEFNSKMSIMYSGTVFLNRWAAAL